MQKKSGGSSGSSDTLVKPVTPGRFMRVKTIVGPAPQPMPTPLAEDRIRKVESIQELSPDDLVDDEEKTVRTQLPVDDGLPKIYVNKNNYFVLEGETGRGGMGVVYKARHVHKANNGEILGNPLVAVKQIIFNFPPEWPKSFAEKRKQELIASFLSEVKLAFKLQHENIVEIKFFGQMADDSPYYVMEFLEGKSLGRKLDERLMAGEGPFPWMELRDYVIQSCRGLEEAHGYRERIGDGEEPVPIPIIHRDIKPENIFIAKKGGKTIAKVLDFGLGKLLHPASPQNTSPGQSPGGTAEYMPQEQILGWPTDHRTDIYSIGAMVYHLLTGQVVDSPEFLVNEDWFTSPGKEKWEAFVERRIKGDYRPMAEANPDVLITKDLEEIVRRCLEREPEKRYQSVAELREAFENAFGGEVTNDGTQVVRIRNTIQDAPPAEAASPQSPDALAKKGRNRLFLKYMLAAGAATVIGISGAYLASRDGNRAQVSHIERLAQAQPQAKTDQPAVEPPRTQPVSAQGGDAGARAADAEIEAEHSLTFRTRLSGVDVLLGDTVVCTTSQDGSCSLKLAASTDSMTFVLRKRGFETVRHSVVPDRDQSVDIPLERRAQPSKTRQNGTKQPPRITTEGGGTGPRITTEE